MIAIRVANDSSVKRVMKETWKLVVYKKKSINSPNQRTRIRHNDNEDDDRRPHVNLKIINFQICFTKIHCFFPLYQYYFITKLHLSKKVDFFVVKSHNYQIFFSKYTFKIIFAYPKSETEISDGQALTHVKDDGLEDEHGARRANDGEGLAREQMVDHAANRSWKSLHNGSIL